MKLSIDDFNLLAVLGKGGQGKVMLAKERASNKFYAVKIIKKEFILKNNEVNKYNISLIYSTKSEKRCLQLANHPFLIHLDACFQSESYLYFVMEFISGGDLMLHIQRGRFVPKQVLFYGCEILLALEYWHTNCIVFRYLHHLR
jgi:serine/threonine protein kinase